MKNEFKCYSDSGHGWCAVKRKFLQELGILHQITPYSYQRGASVYLEEDCDLTLFVNTYTKKFGVAPKLVMTKAKFVERSPIRSYERFSAVIVSKV